MVDGTPLFGWMEAREEIRVKRSLGLPPPWTDDPILGSFAFTNPLREHDAVSVWIQQNITDPFVDHRNLWLMLCIARLINWPGTLAEMMDHGAWPAFHDYDNDGPLPPLIQERMVHLLQAKKARGEKVYTGAYIVYPNAPYGGDKAEALVANSLAPLAAAGRPPMDSMQGFVKYLTGFKGWGGFMSYEVACDLRWAEGWLDKAPDIRTWANPGPGAHRGLNRLRGISIYSGGKKVGPAIADMRELLAQADSWAWGVKWPRQLEMRDIEHSLCEFDKYERARTGQGSPKARFDPFHRPPLSSRWA